MNDFASEIASWSFTELKWNQNYVGGNFAVSSCYVWTNTDWSAPGESLFAFFFAFSLLSQSHANANSNPICIGRIPLWELPITRNKTIICYDLYRNKVISPSLCLLIDWAKLDSQFWRSIFKLYSEFKAWYGSHSTSETIMCNKRKQILGTSGRKVGTRST